MSSAPSAAEPEVRASAASASSDSVRGARAVERKTTASAAGRVGGRVPQLLGLLVAQTGERHAREREHDVAVREGSHGAGLDAKADGRALGLLPEARRRPRLEIHLVDAGLFVERRPRPVRIDRRDVRSHRRGEDHLLPPRGVERGKVSRSGRVGERVRGAAEPLLERTDSTPQRGGESSSGPGDGRALERGRGGRPRQVFACAARGFRLIVDRPQLVDPVGERHPQRAGRGTPARLRLEVEQQSRSAVVEGRRRRSVGRDAPQAVGVEPVGRGLRECSRVDGAWRIAELLARLRDDGAGRVASEPRRPPARDSKGVRASVVGRRRLGWVGLGGRVDGGGRHRVDGRAGGRGRRGRRRGRSNDGPASGLQPDGHDPTQCQDHPGHPRASARHRRRKGSRPARQAAVCGRREAATGDRAVLKPRWRKETRSDAQPC